MSSAKTIRYMVDRDTGFVWSAYGDEYAIPILDWDGMTEENQYKTKYNLEKVPSRSVVLFLDNVIRTRKIPTEIKNTHRQFWGLNPL